MSMLKRERCRSESHMCSSPGEDCNRRSVTQESLLESAPAYNSPRVVKCYGESAQVAKDGARQNSK